MISAGFFVPDRRRRDIDNMLKNVLDGLVGVVFKDDAQVVGIHETFKRLDRANPRTELRLTRTSGHMT